MTLFEKQKEFFLSGKTHSLSLRKAALTRLYKAVSLYEDRLSDALYQDLGKSAFESYETEIGLILSEIRYTLHHLKRWAQPKSVPTSIVNFPGKSTIYPQPKGVVLIISPWNYPCLLYTSIQLCLNEPTAFSGRMAHYGSFRNVRNYIALIGKKTQDLQEKCGYYGEKIVLKAQQLGLNTCWVALTYSKGKTACIIEKDEKLRCV